MTAAPSLLKVTRRQRVVCKNLRSDREKKKMEEEGLLTESLEPSRIPALSIHKQATAQRTHCLRTAWVEFWVNHERFYKT